MLLSSPSGPKGMARDFCDSGAKRPEEVGRPSSPGRSTGPLFTAKLNKREAAATGRGDGCAKNAEAGRLLSSFLLFLPLTNFCIFILDCCRYRSDSLGGVAAVCNSRPSRRVEREKIRGEGEAREKRPAVCPIPSLREQAGAGGREARETARKVERTRGGEAK